MERSIVYKPRNGEEMSNAAVGDVPILLYSVLCQLYRNHGPDRTLRMLMRNRKYIILLQNPKNMNDGHWMSLSFDFPSKSIYFFSSYGGKPDREKIEWLDTQGLAASGQELHALNDCLLYAFACGFKIHYNNVPYQKPGDGTATCGIWTVAFLNSNLDPDEFAAKVILDKLTPISLYRKYFLK